MAAPRTILYTGKGGVGKTSVAAATARRCAAAGAAHDRALDRPGALARRRARARRSGAEPTAGRRRPVGPAGQAQDEMERNWAAVQDWLGRAARRARRGPHRAEELTVPPGHGRAVQPAADQAPPRVRRLRRVIVDCAPTGETLRLLSFPDVARWWLDKVFPQQGRILDAARPFARAVLDVSLPGEPRSSTTSSAWSRNLIAMNEILRDHEHVSIRLVMTPDRMVVDEARRTFTYLNLYGYLTDAVVVNRVFPAEVGEYFGAWRERQAEQLETSRDGFAPVPVLQAPYFERGGRRRRDARPARRGAVRRDGTPAGACCTTRSPSGSSSAATARRCASTLPFARARRHLAQEIGRGADRARRRRSKRTMMLPPALDGFEPSGAAFEDGALNVSFDRAPGWHDARRD